MKKTTHKPLYTLLGVSKETSRIIGFTSYSNAHLKNSDENLREYKRKYNEGQSKNGNLVRFIEDTVVGSIIVVDHGSFDGRLVAMAKKLTISDNESYGINMYNKVVGA